jgi:ABC-2 type transport system ATP-binding protein
MSAIVIQDLHKTFAPGWPGRPPVHALAGLSLTVTTGQIYGFLGPNGAGKTTTLKILMGLMTHSRGTVELLGRPAGEVAVRARVGFLPEGPYFYDYLTGEEFLTFYGQLAGMHGHALKQRVTHLLELVGLAEARSRQLRKFSKGMLQRVGLAQAIIHDPELVILDEPMSGLDPIGRKQVRDLILGLRDQGKTVFFSSHIIPDVEMICDRVGIVMKGRMVASGTVEELMTAGHTHHIEVICEGISAADIPELGSLASRTLQQGRRCLMVIPEPERLTAVLQLIASRGGTLISVVPEKRSLEELFVQETKKD